MRVLYAASEVYPLAKTGGLGDVTAALPPALASLGIDIRLLLPGFPGIRSGISEQRDVCTSDSPFGPVTIRLGQFGNVPAYILDVPALFDRPGNLYVGPDGGDWPDNPIRFALFGWTAAHAAIDGFDGWQAEVVHGHDWHVGLTPAYLAAAGRPAPSIFTIHNLAFQGVFPPTVFGALGLPGSFFAVEGVEYYGQVSFMKAALHFADRITTVSPTYAGEILLPEHGGGLDGLLRRRSSDLFGILNGVDAAVWNPATDPHLPQPFGPDDLNGKTAAKLSLQAELGLARRREMPLFGAVTRLTRQKGFDLLLEVLPHLVAEGAQLALLGSGDADLEDGFRRAAATHAGSIGVTIGFDEALAHRIIGGADAILVPSRFEPCGLTQLYGLRYGTLPVVRRTGGLADTVLDASPEEIARGSATGIVFDAADAPALEDAINRTIALFRQPDQWAAVERRGMRQSFGWDRAAREYAALYHAVMSQ